MTEQSYQEGRKIMQKANGIRSMIVKAKGEVAKWTKMEMWHKENLNEGQANGARKALEKTLIKLEERRKQFAELKFPDNNIVTNIKEYTSCQVCGNITSNKMFCDICQEDYVGMKNNLKSF